MLKFINRRWLKAAQLMLSLLFVCALSANVGAQENGGPVEGEQNNVNRNSGDLIRALKLTPEQIAQIRTIREQHKDERRLVTERLRNAQRALDEAIYTDDVSEAMIEERARELAAAQAAAVRLRALTELGIRRVLTPEQLNTLRSLRLRQAEQRRLEREMSLPRRPRPRQPGAENLQQPPPGAPFGRRGNLASPRADELNRPATAPPPKRAEEIRRGRP